jgi:alpha-N-arabinofuranosidase
MTRKKFLEKEMGMPAKKHPVVINLLIIILVLSLVQTGCQRDKGLLEVTAAVPNPSFEEVEDGKPAGWEATSWRGEADLALGPSGHSGERSAAISSEEGADAAWSCEIPLRPFSRYRLSAWIKPEDLTPLRGRGAMISLQGIRGAETEALTGTADWTEVVFDFESGTNDAVRLHCLFGGRGGASGKAWFDDLAITLLETKTLDPRIVVNGDVKGHPISPLIYGQFIEHLGRCIYGGIWAEMLEDRKFHAVPGGEDSPWTVFGDPGSLTMVKEGSFVGDQTPQVSLSGAENGLVQGNLGLTEGGEYRGRLVFSGSPDACPIAVSLVWGEGEGDRQTLLFDEAGQDYTRVPLEFKAGGTTDSGRLEITGRGSGFFLIGTASLMPADNVEGFRRDTLRLLRELNAPVYRWPGGNFVSGYDWKDGLGDPDRRTPRKNPAWKGIEHNDVGLHEYIRFCRLIDTEPMITVNTGLGTVEEAAREVEYCNGAADTPMGKWRAENGHPEPFGVRFWCIGNEMYGGWQLGHMPLEDYIKKHNRTVEALRKVDPGIETIAVGAVGTWSEGMLSMAADHMEYISEHFYCGERPGLLGHVFQIPSNVKRIADAHREYRRIMPQLRDRDIRISLDEWNYWYGPYIYGELGTRYFLKDALGIAAGLHEYYRNSDIIAMANYAQTVNVIGAIKTSKRDAVFAATGLALKLYREHFGVLPLKVSGEPEPIFAAAALNGEGNVLTLSLINATERRVKVPVDFQGIDLKGDGRVFVLTGPGPMAYNEPGKEPTVTIGEKTLYRIGDSLVLPPISASLYKLNIR